MDNQIEIAERSVEITQTHNYAVTKTKTQITPEMYSKRILRRNIANARKHDRRVSRSMKRLDEHEHEYDVEEDKDINDESESEWVINSPEGEWHSSYGQPSLPTDFYQSESCGLSSTASEK